MDYNVWGVDGLAREVLGEVVETALTQAPNVRCVHPANMNINSLPTTCDGVALDPGNYFALPHQTVAAENGIYIYTAEGQPPRLFRLFSDMACGTRLHPSEGSQYGSSLFKVVSGVCVPTEWGKIYRARLGADSQLTGDGTAGAETAFTVVPVLVPWLNAVRRKVRVTGYLYVDDHNAGDTWTVNAYIGDGLGAADQIFSSGAITAITGDSIRFEFTAFVRVVGVAATAKFDADYRLYAESGPLTVEGGVINVGTNFYTTGSTCNIFLSGDSSSAHVDQILTLRDMEVTVYG
jgi:hypothetical protein